LADASQRCHVAITIGRVEVEARAQGHRTYLGRRPLLGFIALTVEITEQHSWSAARVNLTEYGASRFGIASRKAWFARLEMTRFVVQR
jgi:hypothetical protein